MTIVIAVLAGVGVFLAGLGTAAQVDALWIREHPEGPEHSARRSLGWAITMSAHVLSHIGRSTGRMPVPRVLEAGGVALRSFGAVVALLAALLAFCT